jgi:CarD family transcriptional regulator
MTTRKKTAKKTTSRGSKLQRGAAKSAKNSATRKSTASKTLTKLEKAALEARKKAAKAKAAAKSASRPAASPKVKAAAKRATTASKSARAPVKNNVDVAAKDVAGDEQAKAAPAAIEIEENETLSAVKAKTEAKSSSAAKISTPAKAPLAAAKMVGAAPVKGGPAASRPIASAPEATAEKAPAASSPVVALQSAPKAPRPPVSDKPAQNSEEAPAAPKAAKSAAPRHGFKANEFVVYPAHGVGQIVAIEEQEVAGFRLELFVITFVKDKMMLRVPVGKAASVGMRKLSDPDLVKKALDTLLGRARIKRTMWSRRAQEYEAKINSGDLIAIAEVVRDLYRSEAQPEQSYSERQLYEAALDRMAREVAAVQKLGETEALKAIEAQLQKGPRRGKTDASADDAAGDSDVEEAA